MRMRDGRGAHDRKRNRPRRTAGTMIVTLYTKHGPQLSKPTLSTSAEAFLRLAAICDSAIGSRFSSP